MRNPIPLATPVMTGQEQAYIQKALDDNWVSYTGPYVDKFETELAERTDAAYAVATNSGTSAIHLALIAAGVTPGTEVIMPNLSFVAPANAVRYCGAHPIVVDVSSDDWQIDVDKLNYFLEEHCERKTTGLWNKDTKRQIGALLPVHLLGGMADVDELAKTSTKYDLPLVEDAAECLGASYKGRAIGAASRHISNERRFVCTSFNGNKVITTGGGGAVLMNDSDLSRKVRHLATTAKSTRIEFEHDCLGFNYRMTNIAAAMGLAQLEALNSYVQKKRKIASVYTDALSATTFIGVHPEPKECRSSFWLYSCSVGPRSREIIDRLITRGIQVRPLWGQIDTMPYLGAEQCGVACDVAEMLYRNVISLPSSVDLTTEEQDSVLDEFTGIINSGMLE